LVSCCLCRLDLQTTLTASPSAYSASPGRRLAHHTIVKQGRPQLPHADENTCSMASTATPDRIIGINTASLCRAAGECYSDVGQRPGWPHTDLAVFDVRLRKRRRKFSVRRLGRSAGTSPTPPIDGISRPTFERVCSRPMRRECQLEDSLRLNKFDDADGCPSGRLTSGCARARNVEPRPTRGFVRWPQDVVQAQL
jgi:hypothetical protein